MYQILKMAKASIYWDTRRILKNGTYPIMIRVTNKKIRRYYKTGYHHKGIEVEIVSKETGEKETHLSMEPLFSSKIKGKENKIIRDKLFKLLNKAEKTISDLPQFDFSRFEELYLNKSKTSIFTDVFESFKNYQEKLEKENRASTASSYECASISLKTYIFNPKEEDKDFPSDISYPFRIVV